MAMSYEEIIPTPIENARVRKILDNGVHKGYYINANEGYVLHDNTLDEIIYDDFTGEPTGEVIRGFSEGTKSCGANYDWEANPREFYAVLRTEVPENQIFGGNNHETA
jgi:hypothetical protein